MPLYQYECQDHTCLAVFEAFAPMAQASRPRRCPVCGWQGKRMFVPVHVESDATVYSGEKTDFGKQFKSKAMQEFHLAQAKKNGVNITGKVYDPQLANYPGDPRAWVGSDSDVRQVAEDRNLGLKGKVNVAPRHDGPVGERPKPGLAEKHVREMVHERMVVDPGQKLSKVVEDVVNDHAPHNGKRIIRSPKRARKRG